jgi:glutathione S-transferase
LHALCRPCCAVCCVAFFEQQLLLLMMMMAMLLPCMQEGKPGKYLTGDELSHGDLAVFCQLSVLQSGWLDGEPPPSNGRRHLESHHECQMLVNGVSCFN